MTFVYCFRASSQDSAAQLSSRDFRISPLAIHHNNKPSAHLPAPPLLKNRLCCLFTVTLRMNLCAGCLGSHSLPPKAIIPCLICPRALKVQEGSITVCHLLHAVSREYTRHAFCCPPLFRTASSPTWTPSEAQWKPPLLSQDPLTRLSVLTFTMQV